MLSVAILTGTVLTSLGLGITLHLIREEKDAENKQTEVERMVETTSKNQPIEEVLIPVVTKPRTTTPELRALWYFFEAFEKGNAKTIQDCDTIRFEQGNVDFRINNSSDGASKYVYVYHFMNRLFDITYHVKTKKFTEFKDGMSLLDEENMAHFVHYFQMIVHSPLVSERQVEKTTLANEIASNPKKATPQTKVSAFSWEDYLKPLKKDPLHPSLLETTVLLAEVLREKEHLEAEDAHRLERVEKRILPELVQSYLHLSKEERTTQEEALNISVGKIQKILNDLKNEARKQYVTAFEKNVERINQLEA